MRRWVGTGLATFVVSLASALAPEITRQQIEVGDRVVVALRDQTDLHLFSSAVWYLLPDGTVGTIGHEQPAATHEELFARLRQLPDTAMAQEESRGFPLALGASLALAAGAALALRRVAQPHVRPSALPRSPGRL